MKKIVLTGGGTAGHVTPNIALIPELQKDGFEVYYIGSYEGMERHLIEEMGIPYTGISTGKLRRYFSWKNFTDPVRVIRGYNEASRAMKQIRPDVVFSKGGFVSVPVVFAAAKLHIPSLIHESDMSPGLANKLSIPKAAKICANFPEALENLPKDKAVLTGTPIRRELFMGSREAGLSFAGLTGTKPVLLVTGGSLGAVGVNNAVRAALPLLLKKYDVVHLCGKGKLDESLKETPGYVQFEYVDKEMRDIFAMADVVISRAGANAICELLALKKPTCLIPLPANASRGDQLLNAASFEKQGYSLVLHEEDITTEKLVGAVNELYDNREKYISSMKKSSQADSIKIIIDLIDKVIEENKNRK